MIISSTANPRIKHIRSLATRQEREKTQQFFIEGIRIVGEAVQMGADIEMLVYAPSLLKSHFASELVREQQERGISCLEVSPEVFKSLSIKDGPQGIGAIVHQRWESLEQVMLQQNDLWVALDAAQDPGNIGTILRTSDAVGCTGLILLGNSADPYDSGALRASMGAIFSQRLIKAAFDDFVQWKQHHTPSVVGASDAAETDYRATTYHRPIVLLMGSEREGLSSTQQLVCDRMVQIPMIGRSDSLNLAVATGIILYEIFYQTRTSLPQ
jgi:TrmH family RNA methyltransferase